MEYRVDAAVDRKLETISRISNALKNYVGAIKFEHQLMMRSRSDRRLDIGLEFHEHPVTNLKDTIGPLLIRLHLHTVAHTLQVLL
jgi:hypothetical protein